VLFAGVIYQDSFLLHGALFSLAAMHDLIKQKEAVKL
jgi:hypothetical protein